VVQCMATCQLDQKGGRTLSQVDAIPLVRFMGDRGGLIGGEYIDGMMSSGRDGWGVRKRQRPLSRAKPALGETSRQ
jgi:hypothetical protein